MHLRRAGARAAAELESERAAREAAEAEAVEADQLRRTAKKHAALKDKCRTEMERLEQQLQQVRTHCARLRG